MGNELSAVVTVQKVNDRTTDAVPRTAIVALAICKEPNGDYAPKAVRAVDGNGADWIVHLQHPVHKLHRDADKNSRKDSNDHGSHRIDEARRRCYRHETGKQTVAGHRCI